ncbi:MAG: hypothetical protein WBV68_13590, partial [Exiguobacterium oxidotolerans]
VATDCFSLYKRFETDCALNRLHDWISVTLFPKKRHVSLTPTGKSAFLTRLSDAGKTLLVVRENGLRLARGKQRNMTLDLPIARCLQSEGPALIS